MEKNDILLWTKRMDESYLDKNTYESMMRFYASLILIGRKTRKTEDGRDGRRGIQVTRESQIISLVYRFYSLTRFMM